MLSSPRYNAKQSHVTSNTKPWVSISINLKAKSKSCDRRVTVTKGIQLDSAPVNIYSG